MHTHLKVGYVSLRNWLEIARIWKYMTVEPLLQHTRTRTWPMRARDKFVHRWKADRQVGHPVILAGPAKMIGRTFYSTTASTDEIF